jgi:O-antigen/teichoic acid export membrane protein
MRAVALKTEVMGEHKGGKPKSYAADVLRVASGASFAQFFSILAAPLLSRMFPPEAFGLMAIYTSLIGTAGVVITLRYDQAIMLPEDDGDAANVFVLAILTTLVVGSILAGVTVLWGGNILDWLAAGRLIPYMWLVPVSIILSGLYQAVLMWNSRQQKFSVVAGSRALSSGISNSLQLSGGFGGMRSGVILIASAFVANISALVFAAAAAWRSSGRMIVASIRAARLKWAAKRYVDLPLYNTWSVLLNTLSWQMPALLLARYFGTASAGYFSIGMRVLSIPMDVLAVSIGQVLFQRAAAARADGTLGAVVEGSVARLLKFSLFPILAIGLIAPDLFSVVLGHKWYEGGIYVRILAPWLCVWFLASPLSVLFNVLEWQRLSLFINLVICVTRLGSLYVGHLWNSVHLALALFAGTGLLVYGWLCLTLVRGSGARLRRLALPLIQALFLVIPTALFSWWLSWHHAGVATRIVVVAIPVTGYVVYELWRDPALSRTVRARFRKVA